MSQHLLQLDIFAIDYRNEWLSIGFVSGAFPKHQLATEVLLKGLERLLDHASHVCLFQDVAQLTGNTNIFPVAFRCPRYTQNSLFPLLTSIAFIFISGLWCFSNFFFLFFFFCFCVVDI